MTDPPLLFLDADILVSPVTRTLLTAGARADDLRWTWSAHVEGEADRHDRGRSVPISIVRRTILHTELSQSGNGVDGLVTTTEADRQVVADAVGANAQYLITTDVDDFAYADLAAHSLRAVNPDYFMAHRFAEHAYREGVGLLAEVQKNPSRTASEVHRMLGRRHPHLTARFADVFKASPVPADRDQPSLLFWSVRCIRCDAQLDSPPTLSTGVCGDHQPDIQDET